MHQEIRGYRVGVGRADVVTRVAELAATEIVDLTGIKRGSVECAADWCSTKKGANFDFGELKEMGGVGKSISLQTARVVRSLDVMAVITGNARNPQRGKGPRWRWPPRFLRKHLLAAAYTLQTKGLAAVSGYQVVVP